jgi:uncharacterized protein (TIGR03000 family)
MYKQCLSVVAGLLATAAFALSPGTTAAQHHGGGGHAGGGHPGGGTWHGGGWHDGGWHVGIGIGYPWYGGYGYRGYYGYSPYYYGDRWGDYDTYPYYGDAPSYYSGSPTYSGMSSSYGYGAPAQAQDNAAHIRVIVPPDAKVWFGNTATQQTGAVRHFESPELTTGKDYTYDIKAQWTEEGKEVTRTRQVNVRAGSYFSVDFTRPMSGEGTSATPNR